MKNNFYQWLVNRLPRKLCYYCAIRLGSHASINIYPKREYPNLTFFEVMHAWDKTSQ